MRTRATEQSKPITVVIPLVQAHDHYIPGLLASLTGESDHIHEVILARSSLERQRSPDYSKWALSLGETYGLKVVAVTTHKRATTDETDAHGEVRANMKYVASLDAGAFYVDKCFWSNGNAPKFSPDNRSQSKDVVHIEKMFSATLPNGRKPTGEGRMLIRTSIQEHVRFGRRYPGEDGQFCRDVLWNLGAVSYIPGRLSVYRASLTAEASTQLLDRTMRRVLALRKLGWAALYR